LALCVNASGCSSTGAANEELLYPGGSNDVGWYVGEETKVAHSNFIQDPPDDVLLSQEPRTIATRREDVVRELTLGEVIHIALINNEIVQTGTQAAVGQKEIFNNADNIASVYDQAINETGVLFGRRSVEAALADFDATWRSSMTWGRSRTPTNSNALSGATSIAETWNYSGSLTKQFATGGSLTFSNNWSYLGSNDNSGSLLFPSSYTGDAGFEFRQPLLAGSGVEFTRIAGPVNPNFGAIAGVSQGVVIARINSDISLAGFEASVRDSMRDLHKAYWTLYLNYRNYETAVIAHRSAHQTWKEAKIKLDVGTLKAADEAQALEQFYATQARVETALNALYKSETGLRRLMGLQLSDGEIIRPADTPVVANFKPDWQASMAEALTRRVELRRQKWNIKSLQFQLQAANSLVRPQFDFVSGSQLNGFGDQLTGSRSDGGASTFNLGSGVGTLLSGDYGAWSAGFELSVPIGFRSARTQVRNYELRVAKARAVLSQIEREIAHDVTTSIQDVTAGYTSAATNEERLVAARRRVRLLDLEREEGTTTLDLVLRAQTALSQAENDYHARVIDFTNAMIDLEYSRGSLLASSGVQLAEGAWDCCAYQDAYRRAMERTNAMCNEHLRESPPPFASPTVMSAPQVEPMMHTVPDGLLEGLPADMPEVLIDNDSGSDFDPVPSREVAPDPPGMEPFDALDDDMPSLDSYEAEPPAVPALPDVAFDDPAFFGGEWQSTGPDPQPGTSRSILQLGHTNGLGVRKKSVITADHTTVPDDKAKPRIVPAAGTKPVTGKTTPKATTAGEEWNHIPGPFNVPTALKQLKSRRLPSPKDNTVPIRFDELFGDK
jgi:outer membrane protein TolC